ncbi:MULTISPECIES: hypothetical protein [unclassified Burkholderia]|uniref:hypothetical protein n=1 Tax=unclassified Burkholderia TaxID=2613784 RepID=UPI00197D19B6|nr:MULTISPECIES: hypothetical protein [unclassified Burkholderia]MBN3769268.1 hypothetical protein [Burkholderia sp. Se-20378]MBN3793981.1 hypothetical protein [Burkholderia sp. Ac-20392]
MTIFYQMQSCREVRSLDVIEGITLAELVSTVSGSMVEQLKAFEEDGDLILTEERLIVILREKRHPKLHFHPHCEVKVVVHFNGRVIERLASPAMTVSRLKKWADSEFGVDPVHAAEHVLQLSGTTERPIGSTHLGALTQHGGHCVSFDLVPNERFQG